MSARVSVSISNGPDITAIAIKAATTPEEIDRLAAEAGRLRETAHPGVVAYVDHREQQDRAELHTVYAGESLERWRGTVEQVAGLTAALATTLAELHQAGVVHGRVERSHVLRGPGGRPVLCGLSPPADDAEPAADVAALGHLLTELLADAADDRRRRSRWRSLAGPGPTHRALGRVADHATDPVVGRRPTASRLAQAILEAAPGAELPDGPPPRPSADSGPDESHLFEQAFVDQHDTGEEEIFVDRPWHDTGRATVVLDRPRALGRAKLRAPIVIVGLVGLAALTAGWISRPGSSDGGPPGRPDSAHATSKARTDCPEPFPDHRADGQHGDTADVNGDGCPESIVITADGVIEVDGQRWAVGEPDDAITLGDWDCDGSATPAVYRRSTGDVFVFDRWADRGQPLTVQPVAQVRDGVSFADLGSGSSDTGAASCDAPVIELSSGGKQAVEVSQ